MARQLQRRLAIAVGILTALVGSTLAGVAPAEAAESATCADSAPPVLSELEIDEPVVDVRQHSDSLTVTARVSDPGSGIRRVYVARRSTTDADPASGRAHYLDLVSGDSHDGSWVGDIEVRQHSTDGRWTLELSAIDYAGNQLELENGELADAGFPRAFRVRSNPDDIRPRLRNFSFTPEAVDTREGAQRVKVTAVITDKGGSAVERRPSVKFAPGPHSTRAFGVWGDLERVPGTNTFVGSLRIPRHADLVARNSWRATMYFWDRVGNYTAVDPARMRDRGWVHQLQIVNDADRRPPKLNGFDISPTTLDSGELPLLVSKVARVTDVGSGTWFGDVYFEPSDSDLWLFPTHLAPSSGTRHDGVFEGPQQFGCWAVGTYTISRIELFDHVGNVATYDTTSLQAKGFSTEITVME